MCSFCDRRNGYLRTAYSEITAERSLSLVKSKVQFVSGVSSFIGETP